MRLADLHRHLDGSLRPSTVEEWAREAGVGVPADLRFFAGMGLAAALSRFAFTLSLLQRADRVRRAASEICEDAASEGVSTLEIRFAPQLHRCGEIDEIVAACVEGAAGRAGVVLCALYGDPPPLVERLVDVARAQQGVVGIDLAGAPSPEQNCQTWKLDDYGPAFRRAAESGLGRTVHAGEGRPPDEIRRAVERLHAQRIGHGTTLLDDPAVLDLVLERGIVIEACLTSNLHTGAISALDAHPLPRWLSLGVRACINTDNTLLSDVDAPAEHARAAALPGMTPVLLERAVQHGHHGAFTRQFP